jgi:outer membrane protein TolC
MEVPLQAGTYYKGTAAGLDLKRAEEQARNQRQMVALDVERLFSEVRAAQSELAVRREAIQAAELSVEANEQSFKGGFRTRIDVLNAIQAMFQAKADYASTLLRLGESWASLHLMTAHDIDTTLRQVQSYMFLGKP